jgi:hypothetical protein
MEHPRLRKRCVREGSHDLRCGQQEEKEHRRRGKGHTSYNGMDNNGGEGGIRTPVTLLG